MFKIQSVLIGLLLCPSLTPRARAFEIGAGGGIVTQGDGRLVPAAQGWMQLGPVFWGTTLLGEKNSAFAQQTLYTQLTWSAYLGKSKSAEANIGVGGMLSRTRVTQFSTDEGSKQKISKSAGLAMGLRWTPLITRRIRYRLHWDSLFIPPGESVLYMTYGHMQSVTTGFGWDL